jgi:hypothetical protein
VHRGHAHANEARRGLDLSGRATATGPENSSSRACRLSRPLERPKTIGLSQFLMNGIPNVEALLRPQLGNPDVIALLERVLAEARAGRVAGLAVAFSAGPGNMNASAAGGCQAELFMGCSAIQGALLGSVAGGAPSKVLRPV